MKKCISVAALAATALLSTSAWSQWYLGAAPGVATSRLGGSAGGLALTARDAHNVSLKMFGGYQFNEHLGVEAQYADLGRFGYTACAGAVCNNGSVHARQWGLAGVGTWPLKDNYFLTAKLGVTQNHLRGATFCAGAACADGGNGTRTDLLAGVGVGYRFNRNISMLLEYEHFGKLMSAGGFSAKTDNWSANLRYEF